MAAQPRSARTTANQEALDLLQTLIETPPAPSQARLLPIALRSTVEQRRYVLGRYLLRTWVDALLRHAERLVLLATLLVFGVWFADGPVRDWLHEQQAAPNVPVVSAAAPPSAPPSAPAQHPSKLDRSVPLPYTTPAMAREDP